MPATIRTRSFPFARLNSTCGGLPVEVALIAQLGHGAGDKMFNDATAAQRSHADFIDALDEPSARLGAMDLPHGDATSLYSFAVGAKGHPFHRHAGHRIFTAVSGSGGAQLRFSTATPAQVDDDPESFMRALRYIDIPADCLFTVRFGGDTWHQFVPLSPHASHPAFFALSCHTNELGGDLDQDLRERVEANAASIPALTTVLPAVVSDLMQAMPADQLRVPNVQLSLDAAPGTVHALFCRFVRRTAGLVRGLAARWRRSGGFLSESSGRLAVSELKDAPAGSLLVGQLPGLPRHHQDVIRVSLSTDQVDTRHASTLLSRVLEEFLNRPAKSVSRLMALRNVLARPLGLRTSKLGCPVSSLLSPARDRVFASRFPVIDQHIDPDDRLAQVILGADDKHLTFRSCVSVQVVNAHRIDVILGTRVHCKNLFGRFYMACIQRIHRSYIAPTMLRMAVEQAFPLAAMAQADRIDPLYPMAHPA